jgi:hypothetical protein
LEWYFYTILGYLSNPVLYCGLDKWVVYLTLRYNAGVENFTPVLYMWLIVLCNIPSGTGIRVESRIKHKLNQKHK